MRSDMSWTNVKLYLATMCLVTVLCYVPSVVLDIHLSRLDLVTEETYKFLRSLEKQRKQTFDIQYRKDKLVKGFHPLFYPKLIRSPKGDLSKLAKKYDVAPLAPQPNELLYYCNEGYGLVSYRSDRYGFRNPDDVWEKGDKTFVIGDSYVHGACIPNPDETIVGYLATEINAINLGTSSNGPIHYAAIAKAIVSNFDAKNIVMVFYPNDNLLSDRDNAESYFYEYYWRKTKKPYFSRRGSEYLLNDDLISFYKSIKQVLLSNINLNNTYTNTNPEARKYYELTADEARNFIVEKIGFLDSFSLDNLKLQKLWSIILRLTERKKPDLPFSTKLAIDELKAVCRNRCNPLVIYIPNSELWRPDASAESYRRRLQNYTLAKNIAFVDTTERLRSLTDSEAYAVKGPHLSQKGYQIVSDAILKAIRR